MFYSKSESLEKSRFIYHRVSLLSLQKGKSESPPSNSIKDSVKTTVKAQSAAFWQIGAILEESKHSRMLRYICNMHE